MLQQLFCTTAIDADIFISAILDTGHYHRKVNTGRRIITPSRYELL